MKRVVIALVVVVALYAMFGREANDVTVVANNGAGIAVAADAPSVDSINKGDEAIVPNWQWVDVVNPKVVHSDNNDFKHGDTCGIDTGGKVQVLAKHENRLLVHYQYTSLEHPAAGTRCPSGIVFFLDPKEFSTMTARYEAIKKANEAETALVKNLLGEK